VAAVCVLNTGIVGKALLLGAARRHAKKWWAIGAYLQEKASWPSGPGSLQRAAVRDGEERNPCRATGGRKSACLILDGVLYAVSRFVTITDYAVLVIFGWFIRRSTRFTRKHLLMYRFWVHIFQLLYITFVLPHVSSCLVRCCIYCTRNCLKLRGFGKSNVAFGLATVSTWNITLYSVPSSKQIFSLGRR
jgi:hypothetical protein